MTRVQDDLRVYYRGVAEYCDHRRVASAIWDGDLDINDEVVVLHVVDGTTRAVGRHPRILGVIVLTEGDPGYAEFAVFDEPPGWSAVLIEDSPDEPPGWSAVLIEDSPYGPTRRVWGLREVQP